MSAPDVHDSRDDRKIDFTITHICCAKTYRFYGWYFEWGISGPWPLNNDGGLRKRAGDKFWKMCDKFAALTDKEKEKYQC